MAKSDATVAVEVALNDQFTKQFQGVVKTIQSGAKDINRALGMSASTDARLRNSIKQTTAATNSWGRTAWSWLTKTDDKSTALNTRFKQLSHSLFSLRHVFGTIVGGMVIRNLVQAATKAENMERAFTSLTKAAGMLTDKALAGLRKATVGSVHDMDLMQSANTAMILGVVKSKKDLEELAYIGRRLGKAMGIDARQGFDNLAVGIARQSRMLLDNLGIIVRVEDSYKKYAEAVGKNVEDLTDEERKTAFRNAALTAARKKVGELGVDVLSTSERFGQMNAQLTEMRVILGEALLPAFVEASKQITQFVKENQGALADLLKSLSSITTDGLGPMLKMLDFVLAGWRKYFDLVKDMNKERDKEAAKLTKSAGKKEATALEKQMDYRKTILDLSKAELEYRIKIHKAFLELNKDMIRSAPQDPSLSKGPASQLKISDEAFRRIQTHLKVLENRLTIVRERALKAFNQEPLWKQVDRYLEESSSKQRKATKDFYVYVRDQAIEAYEAIKPHAEEVWDMARGIGMPHEEAPEILPFDESLESVNRFGEALQKLLDGIRNNEDALIDLKDTSEQVWAGMEKGLKDYAEEVQSVYQNVREAVYGMFRALEDNISDVIFDAMMGKLKSFKDYVSAFAKDIARIISQMAAKMAIGAAFSAFGLPTFQHGGVVMGPTPAVVGEAGPEAIIPLKGGNVPVEIVRGGESGVVHNHYYNIQTIDSTTFDAWLLKRKRTVEGISMNAMGRDRTYRASMGAV